MTQTYRPGIDSPEIRKPTTVKSTDTVGWWHTFHRWTKWTDDKAKAIYRNGSVPIEVGVQWKRCVKCNKYQQRYLDD